MCPSFTCSCLETKEEENKSKAREVAQKRSGTALKEVMTALCTHHRDLLLHMLQEMESLLPEDQHGVTASHQTVRTLKTEHGGHCCQANESLCVLSSCVATECACPCRLGVCAVRSMCGYMKCCSGLSTQSVILGGSQKLLSHHTHSNDITHTGNITHPHRFSPSPPPLSPPQLSPKPQDTGNDCEPDMPTLNTHTPYTQTPHLLPHNTHTDQTLTTEMQTKPEHFIDLMDKFTDTLMEASAREWNVHTRMGDSVKASDDTHLTEIITTVLHSSSEKDYNLKELFEQHLASEKRSPQTRSQRRQEVMQAISRSRDQAATRRQSLQIKRDLARLETNIFRKKKRKMQLITQDTHNQVPGTSISLAQNPDTTILHTLKLDTPISHTLNPDTPISHTLNPDTPIPQTPSPDTTILNDQSLHMPSSHTQTPDIPMSHAQRPDMPISHAQSLYTPIFHIQSSEIPISQSPDKSIPHTQNPDTPMLDLQTTDMPISQIRLSPYTQILKDQRPDTPISHFRSPDKLISQGQSQVKPILQTQTPEPAVSDLQSPDTAVLPAQTLVASGLHTRSPDIPGLHTQSSDSHSLHSQILESEACGNVRLRRHIVRPQHLSSYVTETRKMFYTACRSIKNNGTSTHGTDMIEPSPNTVIEHLKTPLVLPNEINVWKYNNSAQFYSENRLGVKTRYSKEVTRSPSPVVNDCMDTEDVKYASPIKLMLVSTIKDDDGVKYTLRAAETHSDEESFDPILEASWARKTIKAKDETVQTADSKCTDKLSTDESTSAKASRGDCSNSINESEPAIKRRPGRPKKLNHHRRKQSSVQ
ncbi:MAGE-like protein 2 [Bagarius yarrelli]|uniref:MAGE-like protein 2 n=1 Tax=Bagarius yarrelli TaxID=175774 RepID=A0A556U876_BAGYA|nr:MAGE-like protein 2 [Bagarius yarrelli]